ncbi:MAG: endonuclease III domain-containing protein [Planctomycetota bacterium]
MSATAADPVVVAAGLDDRWPDATCELYARDPWELLVAAILSVRTADERVNQVMAVLCEHLTGPEAYAALAPAELVAMIRRVPFYTQKARAITEAARAVVRHHAGQVPVSAEDLRRLPGVGRKVAAVVLGNAFNQPTVAADVHVQRVVHRLGWTVAADPLEAERAFEERLLPKRWVRTCHQMIRLGRDHCRPRRPWCSSCPLATACPRIGVTDAR